MKKGVLIAKYTSYSAANGIVKMLNENIKEAAVLYYVVAWIDGAFPYAILKIVDVEGED